MIPHQAGTVKIARTIGGTILIVWREIDKELRKGTTNEKRLIGP
jgi:hypothetical protein